jgi:xanthine dehydrogenase accessory factor
VARRDLKATAQSLLDTRTATVVVEVARTQGSVPRESGTRMLVTAEEVHGTIGGGHLEWQAIAQARQLLSADPALASQRRHVALGPSLGQCCGGALDLAFEPLNANHLDRWPPRQARFCLQLYGAGHVGRALVRLLADIDCQVQWIDEREGEFPASVIDPPHIQRVCVEPVDAEVAQAPPQAFYLVMTHSHDLDLAISTAILRRNDFAYFGLIGSQTKRARFLKRFEQRGLPAEAIARMTCPIGVPGIRGKEPEVLAIAIAAQLLQTASNLSPPD